MDKTPALVMPLSVHNLFPGPSYSINACKEVHLGSDLT